MKDADKVIVDNISKVTEFQLRNFLHLCWIKYAKARIEPGEAIAAPLISILG
jgi:DNA-directed RNA polymerase III subunit RPC1